MTIRCSRCGCAKFFFTLPKRDDGREPGHHGACCAGCGKPLNVQDVQPHTPLPSHAVRSQSE